jgi:glyoxylase-like metal-dependent hydrolase (beta-lactamase superfamily II)
MILKQYYLGCLAHASYLIGDETSKTAVVVDPQRDIGQYLREAEGMQLAIRHVFLTHFHADFVAGHLELRDQVGARIHLGARAQAEYAFTPMKDGDRLELGSVRLETLETPGHTPESISILVYDLIQDSRKPHAVLTGDTLFVGDVGRPDLRASLGWAARDLASLLYDSLREKLLALPDATLIYPAHGAGSLCGKSLGKENSSTIGVQRRLNYALQPMTREQFLEIVMADQPDAPAYFTYDAVLNTKERPTLEKMLEQTLKPLTLQELVRFQNAGAQILDVRDPAYFEAAHLTGAMNIGLGGQYATWAGTLLSRERPIVIIADPGREEEAETRLGRIGFDHIAGYLEGGMQRVEERPGLVARIERVAPAELAEQMESPHPPLVLDVRSPQEWRERRIARSVNIPLSRLPQSFGEIPRERSLVVHCASGYRSSMAASLLKPKGFSDLADLAGGIAAWQAARLPLVASA